MAIGASTNIMFEKGLKKTHIIYIYICNLYVCIYILYMYIYMYIYNNLD